MVDAAFVAVSVRVSVSEIAWVDDAGFGGSVQTRLVFLRLPELWMQPWWQYLLELMFLRLPGLMMMPLVAVSVRVSVSEIA